MRKSIWLNIGAIVGASILFYELLDKLSGFLLSVAVFLFLCLLAFLLWHGHKYYVEFEHRRLKLKQHRHEVELQEQEVLAQAAKRRAFERQAHIDQHIQLTRVYPNDKGHVPVLIDADMGVSPDEMPYLALPAPHRPRQQRLPAPRVEDRYPDEPREQERITEDLLPLQVRYEEIVHLLRKGEFPLGIGVNGLEVCTFEQLMTMWICGGSDTGKSNTVAGFVDHAIKNGRNIKLVVIDPHANKEDSLYKRIRCYEQFFKFKVAVTSQEIEAALRWFKQEFLRRKQYGVHGEEDVLLIVDEVQSLTDVSLIDDEDDDAETLKYICKTIKGLAKVCGNESRGFGMFGWFISQNATGVAWLRKVVNTVVSHKMNMMSERRVACNEDEKVARSMDTWPKRGRVVVYGNGLELKVLQMPLFPVRQVQVRNAPRSRYIPTDAYVYENSEAEKIEEVQPRIVAPQQKPVEAVYKPAPEEDSLLERGVVWYVDHTVNGKGPSLDMFSSAMNLKRDGAGRTLWNKVKMEIAGRQHA